MKRLLLSTAILWASALAAPAQDLFRGASAPDEIRASDLMGMRVYASEAALDADETDGPGEGWEDIGEINDLVLARDGSVEAVLVDVGGFLGIGERQVALSMAALRFVSDSATADDVGDYFLVVNASRADLEGAPDYAAAAMGAGAGATAAAVEEASAATAAEGTVPTDELATDGMAADGVGADGMVSDEMATGDAAMTESETEAADTAAAATEGTVSDVAATDAATEEMASDNATVTATGPVADAEMAAEDTAATDATTDMAATDADDALSGAAGTRTPLSREGYVAVGAEMMTADALQGAAVYDANDERVGEVGELLIDEAGMVTDVVVDVGGFLGIGEKPVALQMSSLDVLQQEGGDDLRVYVSQPREELEAMESYVAE